MQWVKLLNHYRRCFSAIILVVLSVALTTSSISRIVLAQPGPQLPVVGVWSNSCKSANITCGNLSPGSSFTIQVNVTNAPTFNSFELWLFYDPAFINATSIDLLTNTVFSSGNPVNLIRDPFTPIGRQVHVAVANFANPPSFTGANGTLVNIDFTVRKTGVSPLVLSAPIANPNGGGTQLLSAGTSILVRDSNGYFRNDFSTKLKFVDNPPGPGPNSPGTWQTGRTVIYDQQNNGTYQQGDVVISGAAPSIGTNLSVDPKIKFVDSPSGAIPNSLGAWSTGKSVVWDGDSSGTFTTVPPDAVISGSPAPGVNLSMDVLHGPIANFTYSPAFPKQGDIVTFNATSSSDPDGGLLNTYFWEIQGASSFGARIPIYHYRLSAGEFSIRLTVFDADDGFAGMQVQKISVALADFHDVALQTLTADKFSVPEGGNSTLSAVVVNNGNFAETYNLTLNYGQPSVVVGSVTNQEIDPVGVKTFHFTFNSAGLAPGFYTIEGFVNLTRDDVPSNNVAAVTIKVLGPPLQTSNLPLVVGLSAIAGIIVIGVAVSLLRRRRRAQDL